MIEVFLWDGRKLKKTSFSKIGSLKGKKIWLDLVESSREELELVQKKFKLHPLTIEDMSHRSVRIKIEEFNKYIFLVAYGLEQEQGYKLLEGDYVLGKNFVISSHSKKLDSHNLLKENKEMVGKLLKRGPDFVLHKLLDNMMEATLPVIEHIEDNIEVIEREVTSDPREKMVKEIMLFKQQIFKMRKIAFSQREKMGLLVKDEYPFLSKDIRPYLRDLYDRTILISDAIENAKESVQATFEAYMGAVNNKMSEVMKVLSIIATIALPLTVVSGIWGTNFLNLPGMHTAYGFWIMIIIMVLMIGFMFMWFVKKKWI